MYCTNCGKEINDHAKFCPECGCSTTESGQKEVQNTVEQSAGTVNPAPIVRSTGGETVQPIGRIETSPQKENQPIAMLFGTCRLVIGIVSIVLCVMISLQSCAVGVVNLFEDSGSASGTAGVILAVSWLIAGIVSIAGRKHIAAVSTAAGFYFFGGLMGLADVGIYQDLVIWGFLSFAFGIILVLAVVLRKHEIFRKTWVAVLTELGVIVLMLGIALSIPEQDSAEASGSKNNAGKGSNQETEAENNSKSGKNSEEGKEKKQDTGGQAQYQGSVAALLAEVSDNQVAAKQKYLDQVVSLDGEVSYIGGSEGEYYFSLADPFDPVQFDTINCYADEATVMSIRTGDYVTVTGRVTEGFWNLELKDCEVRYADTSSYDNEADYSGEEPDSYSVAGQGNYSDIPDFYGVEGSYETGSDPGCGLMDIYYLGDGMCSVSIGTGEMPEIVRGIECEIIDECTMIGEMDWGQPCQLVLIWSDRGTVTITRTTGTGDELLDTVTDNATYFCPEYYGAS